VKLAWDRLSLLLGQTWDVISPLYATVNNDTLMWNAGNLGDRRPQVRVSFEPKACNGTFSLAGALGLTGAVDEKNLDAATDTTRDGEASGLPNVQFRLGFTRPFQRGKSRWGVGGWGHHAWEKTATPVAGEDEFTSRSAGIDAQLVLKERVTL